MTLAALAAMEAAVSRLPLNLLDSYVKVHAANDALVLLVVMVDSIRHRRLHPAFLWGTAFLIFMQTFATWLAGTAAWERAARSILALSRKGVRAPPPRAYRPRTAAVICELVHNRAPIRRGAPPCAIRR